ncbi:replication initiation protein [Belnapia sp. T18]|uniref:Replication initiation protein n=1 Tax=Belnapia arida TaxID=2804533 RepID=A0ABS1UAB8_9PROT|nr:replication initiation protein [Belnapia arida]MBL6081634.1 replication initiation protein [Belnapia arida]
MSEPIGRREVGATNWGNGYSAIYEEKSRKSLEARQRRAGRQTPSIATLAARAAKLATARDRVDARFAEARRRPGFTSSWWSFVVLHARGGDPDAKLIWRAECQEAWAEERRAQRARIRYAVYDRLTRGFYWPGGLIGGSSDCYRPAFQYLGLVSNEHPILKLFVASTPRARDLRTGDTKVRQDRVGSKLLALDSPYVTTARTMSRVLRVDIDRVFPGAFVELEDAITACGVPLPNIAVGHLDTSGRFLRPHLIWLLEDAVAFTSKGREGPKRLYRAVLDALTAALLPIGADPGGRTNALRVKNPLCPAWSSTILSETPFALAPDTRDPKAEKGLVALSSSLDLATAQARLQIASAESPIATPVPDHPDPAITGQSNALFQALSVWARTQVGRHRDEGEGAEETFGAAVLDEAFRLSEAGLATDVQAAVTAKNVARWTWRHYRLAHKSPNLSLEERRARQASGQAKGAVSRRAATLAACIAAARDLQKRTQLMTQIAVAGAAGRSLRTVREHWHIILHTLQAPSEVAAVQVDIDKKQSGWSSCFAGGGSAPTGFLATGADPLATGADPLATGADPLATGADPLATARFKPSVGRRRRPPRRAWKSGAIQAGYEAGEGLTALARKYKVHPSAICHAAKYHGWSRPESCIAGGYTKAQPAVQDAVRAGYEAGNIYQTARRLQWFRLDRRRRQ